MSDNTQLPAIIDSGNTLLQSNKDSGNIYNSKIEHLDGYDFLRITLQPKQIIVSQFLNIAYMDGELDFKGTTQSGTEKEGFWSSVGNAVSRSVTGSNVFLNDISNNTMKDLHITFSPLLHGSVTKIDINPNETWKFRDGSFIACTPNLKVSGNINIFSNIGLVITGQNITYTEISATDNKIGSVWISSHGAVETHEIEVGMNSTSSGLFINHGCFLGMKTKIMEDNIITDLWSNYVQIEKPKTSGWMISFLYYLMIIKNNNKIKRTTKIKCHVLTQSLNPVNLNNHISHIAKSVCETTCGHHGLFNKYMKYKTKYLELK